MRPIICFIISILPVAVVAVPVPPHPNTPSEPIIWRLHPSTQYPPYAPPDLGPRVLDNRWLRSIPGLTHNQRATLKKQMTKAYDKWQRQIAEDFPRDEPPPEKIEEIRENLQSNRERIIEKMQQRTAAKQPTFAADTREGQIQQELRDQQKSLNRILERGCKASDRAEGLRKNFEEAKAEVDECTRESERITVRIQELIRQLQALNRERTIGDVPSPDGGDRFSIKTMEDNAKQWTQHAGGFVQDMIHKASAGGRLTDGGTSLRPYVVFPKLGLALP